MKSKSQLRQELTKKRQSLTPEQLASNSQAICQRISKHFFLPEVVLKYGIYWPFGNEVDIRGLLKQHQQGHIPSVLKKRMQFQPHAADIQVKRHALGMMQPAFIPNLPPMQLNICFLPLLGFDNQGNRLGMGGGYYDRYFENSTDTLLIGVAHDCQQVDALPHDEWDVTLDGIVTESQHLNFQKIN